MMITVIKKKVSSGGRAALRDTMVSLAQDEGHPHLSQGGVGMLLSITFSQNGTEKLAYSSQNTVWPQCAEY